MASAELSRHVEKVVGYPPLCDMGDHQRREFHEALLEADSFEDLSGKWQRAILEAEQTRPKLRVVSGDSALLQDLNLVPEAWLSHTAASDWAAERTPGPDRAFKAASASCASALERVAGNWLPFNAPGRMGL